MKYLAIAISLLLLACSGSKEPPSVVTESGTRKIIEVTPESWQVHQNHRGNLPKFETQDATYRGSSGVNLMSNLNFASCNGVLHWDQQYSGNCWVWGSTAATSIMYSRYLTTSPQLFSVQWFDSRYYETSGGKSAANGGDSYIFANWYNTYTQFIPWSNTNAGYVDGAGNSKPAIVSSKISTTPSIPFKSVSLAVITTQTGTTDQAITNIKAVLDSGTPVVLGFYLPGTGWTDFVNHWNADAETVPWAGVSSYDGKNFGSNGGGHLVCIVGYTADSWIALNSWGTTSKRPNGYFLLPQSMKYNSALSYYGEVMYQYEFDAFNIVWSNAQPTSIVSATIVAPQAVTIANGGAISFTGTGSSNTANPVFTYAWNFGDGTTGSGASINHAYHGSISANFSGSFNMVYTAILTVTDQTGSFDKKSVDITVKIQ